MVTTINELLHKSLMYDPVLQVQTFNVTLFSLVACFLKHIKTLNKLQKNDEWS